MWVFKEISISNDLFSPGVDGTINNLFAFYMEGQNKLAPTSSDVYSHQSSSRSLLKDEDFGGSLLS